jgi:hypothetical protein
LIVGFCFWFLWSLVLVVGFWFLYLVFVFGNSFFDCVFVFSRWFGFWCFFLGFGVLSFVFGVVRGC